MALDEAGAGRLRRTWIQDGLGELHCWIDHAESKANFILAESRKGRIRYIETAELLFAITAVINRLAQIDLRTETNLSIDKTLTPWISQQTDWPPLVAKAFWHCIRNPVMHMGRTSGFTGYDVKTDDGLPILASVQEYLKRDYPTDMGAEFPPGPQAVYSTGPGWYALYSPELGPAPYDDWSGESIDLTFYVFELFEIVRSVIYAVAVRLRDASTEDLERLTKLQRRLPFITCSTLDPRLDVWTSSPGESA
ncbi:MAG: hypothetical protein CVT64_01215 [Actinobacteria bacterium HGW-Actinobacteria-4]|nr:MAG: hypothetical protein CVT64_01215 [Actinobacteria bacterium HGW-Actinobacteria-4]